MVFKKIIIVSDYSSSPGVYRLTLTVMKGFDLEDLLEFSLKESEGNCEEPDKENKLSTSREREKSSNWHHLYRTNCLI